MRRPRLLVFLMASVMTACGTVPGGAPDVSPENIAWRLADLSGDPARMSGGETPTLRLNSADGRAAGNTGCNLFAGPYELRADSLTFGALVTTRRACVAVEMGRQETHFINALTAARTWTVSGNTLVIRGADGSTARFVRQ